MELRREPLSARWQTSHGRSREFVMFISCFIPHFRLNFMLLMRHCTDERKPSSFKGQALYDLAGIPCMHCTENRTGRFLVSLKLCLLNE